MLSVTRIAPGAGIAYLTRQVAGAGHDFRPARGDSVAAYHADPAARGEAPGWWAGDSNKLFGVDGAVSDEQIQRLIGNGQHPQTGQHLGQLWRVYKPMDDTARQAAVEQAWAKLPADATYEQIARAWLTIWTAPERRPLAGLDVTVSPAKSVSLLWAFGDDRVKGEVMAAHHEGVRAAIAHLRAHGAYTRLGANGLVQVDTDGLAVMVYDHRMSRERDPQLHSHIIVSSKIRITKDGQTHWLSLDSRAFYQASIGARAAYERAVEAELGLRLGVAFANRAGTQIREIVGISKEALRLFSKRRTAITADLEHTLAGADGLRPKVASKPWRRQAQVATLRTRPQPGVGESTARAVRRWRQEDREAGLDTAAEVEAIVSGGVLDETGNTAWNLIAAARAQLPPGRELEVEGLYQAAVSAGTPAAKRREFVDAAVRRIPHLAVDRAISDLTSQRAVFTMHHLELALGRVLHVDPHDSPEQDWARVQELAAAAVSRGQGGLRVLTPPALVDWADSLIRASDGRSIYSRHRDQQFSTRAVLAAEHEVIAYAAGRGATPAPRTLLDQVAAGLELTEEKRAALRYAVGDDRRVTAIVGPAGSGKTYLQRAIGLAARQAGIPVLGLTVGQNAAYVLADATRHGDYLGIRTENIAMWLHAQHHPPQGTLAADWALQPGQWVIIDEASQVSTHDLVRLTRMLEPVGGKLILVGDPAQISAIGPGGLLRYLATTTEIAELTEIARFANSWEGPASLRLRAGDLTVLAEYDRHQRILPGHRHDLVHHMVDAWTRDTLDGKDSLIMVETEAEASEIAALARQHLIHAGVVHDHDAVLLADGNRASAGDVIVSRRNDRHLTTGERWVANRDRWRVTATHPDGSLDVVSAATGAALTLPAFYAAYHVQLAYAATVDSAQGRTVDIARAIVTATTTLARLYVMATRGRNLNEIGVVIADEPPEGHPPAPHAAGLAVLADIMRADTTERSATETGQALWADRDSLRYWAPIYDDLTARASIKKYTALAEHIAGPQWGAALAHDPATPALVVRLQKLQAAGYDPALALREAIDEHELDTARSVAAVLTYRIDKYFDLTPIDPTVATSPEQTASYTARLATPDVLAEAEESETAVDITFALARVSAICDNRITTLAELAADQQPAWATALGPVPHDEPGRRQWLAGAAVVAAYRDQYAHTGTDPIGPEPLPRDDPQQWNAWHRAQTVLGVATHAGYIRALADRDLHAAITQQHVSELTQPPYVAGQLRMAHLHLVNAEEHLTTLRLAVPTAAKHASTTAQLADASTPRWWHIGPFRARAAARHAAANAAATRAAHQLDTLDNAIDQARTHLTDTRNAITPLETQHQTWSLWYEQNLPIRYTGLAAAAELARRQHQLRQDVEEITTTLNATTDKVRAVDATRPQPHARPTPAHPGPHEQAGRRHLHDLIDGDPYPSDDTITMETDHV